MATHWSVRGSEENKARLCASGDHNVYSRFIDESKGGPGYKQTCAECGLDLSAVLDINATIEAERKRGD